MIFEGYETLNFAREGRVLTIMMNRPEVMNAVSHRLHVEMGRVFIEAAEDPETDIIILTGVGQAFSAGGDVNWMADMAAGKRGPFVEEVRVMRRIIHGVLDCPKPIIAKVNGDAMGFGASIALLCDIVIAADTARFADPHVRLGLAAGDGGALIWPQLIGFAKARHYLLTGEAVAAPEAERMGLITFAVPAAELDEFVAKYAGKLARGAQSAIRYTKSAVNIALRQLFASVGEAAIAYEGLTTYTGDFREGIASFIEKRRPEFGKE
ncbi:MAG TPA: enoyl-CoA hydratase-related protein [Sphingomonas sp.]|nr:enoyl-CoA hydratase-related protein [Sphingomonas sp.]